jgi:acyl-[acyl-carrier-protein] desaturase
MVIKPDSSIIQELEEQRPPYPVGLLSHAERERMLERGTLGLYRWYLNVSQSKRNWNPDTSFEWNQIRTDHSDAMRTILEGFFAVEQYVPDYTSKTIHMMRRHHGRSHFQIRWGAEEERHSDLWYNTLLFTRARTSEWMAEYQYNLRGTEWQLVWDDPLHVTAYVVIQERATQVNYLNTVLAAKGKLNSPEFANDEDPILARIAQTIAVDEAAHYNFFLEVLRLYMYYYPARTLEALNDVIKQFAMPANQYIPNFEEFFETAYRTGIYNAREYARDVVQVALDNVGVAGRKALELGIKRSRAVPDPDGNMRETSFFFDGFDYHAVESAVKRLFGRIQDYETKIGFDKIDPTLFVPSGIVIAPNPAE